MRFLPASLRGYGWLFRGAGAATLALSLSGLAVAQQEQPPQQTDQPPQSQQAQPQDPQAPPQQDSNHPPSSVDRVPQNSPQSRQQNSQQYSPQNPPPPNGPEDQYAPPPALLTIPSGTVLIMRLNEPLSSDRNQVGNQFSGILEQPIVVNGWVVARRGQVVMGQVKSVQKAGRVKGVSQLGVELTDMTFVNGEQAPILTELWKP